MPTLRNKTSDERYIPALRALVDAGESIDIPAAAAAGFADQTDTWELLNAPAPAVPALPQPTTAPREQE